MNGTSPIDAPAPPPARSRPVELERRRTLGTCFLAAGVALLAASFLATAFSTGVWLLLFPIGLLLVGFGWLMLVFLGARIALAATAAAVLGCGGVVAVSPGLSGLSWRMLIWTHRSALVEAVRILEPVKATTWNWRPDPRCEGLAGLSPRNCAALQVRLRDVGAFNAWKEGPATGFTTHAWVNVRLGILYCPRDGAEPCEAPGRRHVGGGWYTWSM